MLLAAEAVSRYLAAPQPYALLGGDLGRGDGTRAVYGRLEEAIGESNARVIAFHYLQPIMALMRGAVESLESRTDLGELVLVADAGGMYAAKASGVASHFELMTPDVGEVGFLADPNVSHPAYAARHLLGSDGFDPADLARRAAETKGAARVLLIKGVTDRITVGGEVVASVDSPDVPALEAIGGTGDTITGLAAALIAAGIPTVEAAVCAARVNREAGRRLNARPYHRATDLVDQFPAVLAEHVGSMGALRATRA
jgi:NAD(P)H-hydrate repair Nnr-like enzyme with NAD(P)H-hydrate dehydratase domain